MVPRSVFETVAVQQHMTRLLATNFLVTEELHHFEDSRCLRMLSSQISEYKIHDCKAAASHHPNNNISYVRVWHAPHHTHVAEHVNHDLSQLHAGCIHAPRQKHFHRSVFVPPLRHASKELSGIVGRNQTVPWLPPGPVESNRCHADLELAKLLNSTGRLAAADTTLQPVVYAEGQHNMVLKYVGGGDYYSGDWFLPHMHDGHTQLLSLAHACAASHWTRDDIVCASPDERAQGGLHCHH